MNRPPDLHPLLVLAAGIILVFGLQAAQAVLVPLALALMLAAINLPGLRWLQDRRVPNSLAVTTMVLVTIAAVALFGLLASTAVGEMQVALPRYISQARVAQEAILDGLRARGFPVAESISYSEILDPARILNVTTGVLRGTIGFVSGAFIVLLITIFILADATRLPERVERAVNEGGGRLVHLGKMIGEIQHYLAIKTATSAATGIAVGLWTGLMGVDFPVLWGVSAFVLNYIPSLGSVIAAIPAVLVALLQLGLGSATMVGVGYGVINTVIGNFIEPNVLGRSLGLSTLTVIVSLVFWGWVWGPAGMLLSVPLTMVVKIFFEHSPRMRWAAHLMGPTDEPEADRVPAAIPVREGEVGAAEQVG